MGQVVELQLPAKNMECECGSQSFTIRDDMSRIDCTECGGYYIIDPVIEMDDGKL